MNNEENRLNEQYNGEKKWLKWEPYLRERQWRTVREDYSEDGNARGNLKDPPTRLVNLSNNIFFDKFKKVWKNFLIKRNVPQAF